MATTRFRLGLYWACPAHDIALLHLPLPPVVVVVVLLLLVPKELGKIPTGFRCRFAFAFTRYFTLLSTTLLQLQFIVFTLAIVYSLATNLAFFAHIS